MFSRRALEAAACGAVVVSNPSAGTEAAFGNHIVHVASADECKKALDELTADKTARDIRAHRAYVHVQREHSWERRLEDVTERMGLWQPRPERTRRISAVLATKRPEGAERILTWLAESPPQTAEIEPIVITAFDPEILPASLIERTGAIVEQELPGQTLGDCLNRGTDLATGDLIAKVDDDDLYGANYFDDLLVALMTSRADICGKQSHLQYLESHDTTVLRYPQADHRFAEFVCGSTLLMRRAVFEQIRFPSRRVGEDTDFLNRARGAGFRLYSADRFGYISMRRADLDSHTWQVEADDLLSGNETKTVCRGLATQLLEA